MIMISQLFLSLFILITFYQKIQVLSSPVLLWSNVNLPESAVPLSEIPSINLISDSICTLTSKQIQLYLLAVNDLTIEQIQRGSQRNHPVILDAKKDQTKFHFYPNVSPDGLKTFQLIRQSNSMKCANKQFKISSPTIDGTLYDALNTMQTTVNSIQTDENKAVIIVLINKPSDTQQLSRRRRATNETTKRVLISNNQTCMFYAEQLRWNDVNGTKLTGRNYTLNYDGSSCKQNTTNTSSVTLDLLWVNDNTPTDTVKMSLITTIIGRYWHLTNASLNNSQYRHFAYGMYDQMTTPPGYSYVCTAAEFIRFDSSVLHGKYNFTDKFYILNLQFQPFNVSNITFGLPNYCTSFFTSGIWMGITSSLLCLAILLFGIHRMMSIKSNDRFDDPKGKPLVIKAQE